MREATLREVTSKMGESGVGNSTKIEAHLIENRISTSKVASERSALGAVLIVLDGEVGFLTEKWVLRKPLLLRSGFSSRFSENPLLCPGLLIRALIPSVQSFILMVVFSKKN